MLLVILVSTSYVRLEQTWRAASACVTGPSEDVIFKGGTPQMSKAACITDQWSPMMRSCCRHQSVTWRILTAGMAAHIWGGNLKYYSKSRTCAT